MKHKKSNTFWKHVRAITLLPFMVNVVIPILILYYSRSLNIGWGLSCPLNILPIVIGACFLCLGLFMLAFCISLFVRIGQGTLADWDPTHKLVVQGPYRHVRNPMISGVFCILLGESILFGSFHLFAWFLIFVVGNMTYMPLYEEPGLVARFGSQYLKYKKNVPRWIPRIKPWKG